MEIPHSREAEVSVIGSLLLDGDRARAITLEAEDFYEHDCKDTYTAMQEILKKGGAIDQVTVAHELRAQGADVKLTFLSHCLAETPTSFHAEYYAGIVKQSAVNRNLITLASEINTIGYADKPINESIEKAQKLLAKITRSAVRDEILTPKRIVENAEIRYNSLCKVMPGIGTGFFKLDEYTGGLFPGELTILAARPGLGKSTLMLQIARNIGAEKNALVLSLEMLADSLTDKVMVGITGKSARVIRHGNYSEDTRSKLIFGLGGLAESNLHMAQGTATTATLRGYIEKMLSSFGGVSAVFVDYLQLFTDKGKSRYEAITTISRELAVMAKDYKIPIVALSQLSRATEQREDKRPQLSDLRESGAIEQDADIILFLYRDSYYTKSNDTRAELIVAKSRPTGIIGSIKLNWNADRERYYEV